MLEIGSGAVLLITLLPAAIFMTINYIGDHTNAQISLGGGGGGDSFNYNNSANRFNRTLKIEIGHNGTLSLSGLGNGISGSSVPNPNSLPQVINLSLTSSSRSNDNNNVNNNNQILPPPGESGESSNVIKTVAEVIETTTTEASSTTSSSTSTPSTTTSTTTEIPVVITEPRPHPTPTFRPFIRVDDPNDGDNRLGKMFLEELADQESSNSLVQRSILGGNPEIPILPTCCNLQVRRGRERQTLSHCGEELDKSSKIKDIMGVWQVPKDYLLRKEGPRIYRLENQRPLCRSSVKAEILDGNDGEGGGNYFMTNGLLKFNNEYYRTDEYCINGFKGNKIDLYICHPNCSDPVTPCVHKCCDYDEVYSLGMNGKRGGCLKLDPLLNETFWSPTFYSALNRRMDPLEAGKLKYHVIHQNPGRFKPTCKRNMTIVYPYGEEVVDFLNSVLKRQLQSLQFQLRKDGFLLHPNVSSSSEIAINQHSRTTKYCIDGVQNYGEIEKFQNLERQTVLFTCTIPDKENEETEEEEDQNTKTKKADEPKKEPVKDKRSVLPQLPTCCNLNPSSDDKGMHYCMSPDSGSNSNPSGVEWDAAPKFMNDVQSHKFSLQPSQLHCAFNYTKAFILNYSNLPGGGSPSLTPNGLLRFGNEYYTKGEFCVNGIFHDIVEVLMCKVDCQDSRTPCIRKCCQPDEIYSVGGGGMKRGCVPLKGEEGDEGWMPRLYKDMNTPLTQKEEGEVRPHLVQNFPPKFQYTCYKNMTLVFPYKKEMVPLMSPLAKINLQFHLRRDGKVLYRHPVIKDVTTGKLLESVFNNVEYCVDGVRNFAKQGPYRPKEEETVLFVCAMNPPEGLN